MTVILHPDKGYSGPGPGGIEFEDGRAETDDPRVVAYCRNAGYLIDREDADRPAKSATKREWVDHAVASGMDREEAEATTKDALIERWG